MGNVLLLSSAYSWFIGLLVMMIVMAVLFVAIAMVSLKPVRLDDLEDYSAAQAAKKLLAKREAELLTEYRNNEGNAEIAAAIMEKIRGVSTAEQLIDELAGVKPVSMAFADDSLSAEEIESLENETEKVSIEQTFTSQEDSGIKKSFTAKLIQSPDTVKVLYFEAKNCLLCYEKTKARMHWNNEKFYIGKRNVATLTLSGKTICLYLALNPDEYSDSFDVKATKSEAYANTPCLFRIKGGKSLKKAKELIALLMTDYGVMYVKTNHSIYAMPYEDDDALVAKGLARKD